MIVKSINILTDFSMSNYFHYGRDDVSDKHQYSFVNYNLKRNSTIFDLQYRVIFNLNKGNLYQGVVKISFNIKSIKSFGKEVVLNYNGTSVKHITVNGTFLNE